MLKAKINALHKKYSRKSLVGQFLRYLITGGAAFVIDFCLYVLCLYVFEFHYLIANLIGLIAGLSLNYAMSVCWVFTACTRTFENNKITEFILFATVGIIGVGINELLMFFMVDFFDCNKLLSKMIAAIIVLMWNFIARKLMLFKKGTKSE